MSLSNDKGEITTNSCYKRFYFPSRPTTQWIRLIYIKEPKIIFDNSKLTIMPGAHSGHEPGCAARSFQPMTFNHFVTGTLLVNQQ